MIQKINFTSGSAIFQYGLTKRKLSNKPIQNHLMLNKINRFKNIS